MQVAPIFLLLPSPGKSHSTSEVRHRREVGFVGVQLGPGGRKKLAIIGFLFQGNKSILVGLVIFKWCLGCTFSYILSQFLAFCSNED